MEAAFRGQAVFEIVFRLGRPQLRALAKIAFNYLAAVAGPNVALQPAFDGVRRYIRHDEGPQLVEVPLRRQRTSLRRHYSSVQTVDDRVVAHLSLFMRVMYYAVTLAPSGCAAQVSSAHFFDLDTHQVISTAPIPIEVISQPE